MAIVLTVEAQAVILICLKWLPMELKVMFIDFKIGLNNILATVVTAKLSLSVNN